jgi:peptidyl-prolyl cis-trans isomerase SurA
VILTYARESGGKVDDAELDRAVQTVAAQNQLSVPQLRERLAASPLRDARGFSTDWYAMVERAMADPVRK